jgi:hypothetical protein
MPEGRRGFYVSWAVFAVLLAALLGAALAVSIVFTVQEPRSDWWILIIVSAAMIMAWIGDILIAANEDD